MHGRKVLMSEIQMSDVVLVIKINMGGTVYDASEREGRAFVVGPKEMV